MTAEQFNGKRLEDWNEQDVLIFILHFKASMEVEKFRRILENL